MKYAIITILIIMVLSLSGCSIELGHEDHDHDGDGIQDHAPEDHVDENYLSIIEECKSLCNVDSGKYCTEDHTFEVEGKEITGTCRSLSKNYAELGFQRCEGFCREYGKI